MLMAYLLRSFASMRSSFASRNESLSRNSVLSAVGYLLLIYFSLSALIVYSAQRSAEVLLDTDIASTLAGGDSELDQLEEKLEVFEYRFRRLKAWTYPVRQVAKLAIVVSPLDRQRDAGELLLERVEQNVLVAKSAISLGRSTFLIRETTTKGIDTDVDSDVLDDLRSSLGQLKLASEQLVSEIEIAERIGARIDSLEIGGPIIAMNAQIENQETRLRRLAHFSFLLSEVVLIDLDLVVEMKLAFDELDGFTDGGISISEGSDLIAELMAKTERAKSISIEMIEYMPAAVSGSEYGGTIYDIHELNLTAHELITGIHNIVDAGAESIEILAASEDSLFESGDAISAAISNLIMKESELQSAVDLVNSNVIKLLTLGREGTISFGKFGDALEDKVEPLLEISKMLVGAPRVAADIFGIDGEERQYLLLGQTADELRASGGFTSSIWLLTFVGGALVHNDYIEIDSVENSDDIVNYPEARDELQLHMDAGAMYLRDVGWDPHFPAVGTLAVELYKIDRDIHIDGVISLTQWAFIDLVTVLGGLETESGTLSPIEFLEAVENGTDADGTEFLEPLFKSLLDSLYGDNVRSQAVELMLAMKRLTDSKDLMFYSTNSETQQAISRIGWAGDVPVTLHDRLVIIDSNVGWNKVDRQIEREFTYEVDLSDIELPTAKLSLDYENHSNAEIAAAGDCDTQAHVRSIDYAVRLHGCYWNYLRIYVPLGSKLNGGDQLPLPSGSIASQVSELPIGSQTTALQFDDNGTYLSGLMNLEAQDSKNIDFFYTLPSSVVTSDEEGIEYSLDVGVQAGTRGRTGSVAITIPAGYEIDAHTPAGIVMDGQVVIRVDPTRDVTIRVRFSQVDAATR